MCKMTLAVLCAVGLALGLAGAAQAATITHTIIHDGHELKMDFVPVGNVENANDGTGFGAVDYYYEIGKYEVTAVQWAAVIAADSSVGNTGNWFGGQPTGGTSWYEAAKFANWLTTGNANTGPYNTTTWVIMSRTDAQTAYGTAYFIPTENEWYKAAYYDPDKGGPGVGGYWDYATGSDTAPTAQTPPGTDLVKGSANYNNAVGTTTIVGAYNATDPGTGLPVSDSPYGTFDQGGNVWEWNETLIGGKPGVRGGSFGDAATFLHVNNRRTDWYSATTEANNMGFRVSSVPEPATLALLGLGGLGMLLNRKRR